MSKTGGPKVETLKKMAIIIYLMNYQKKNSVQTGLHLGHKRNYITYLYGQGRYILEKGETHKSHSFLMAEIDSIKSKGGVS